MAIPKALKEFFGGIAVWAFNAAGTETEVLSENDGTVRVQLVAWDGAQERVAAETTGALEISLYGKDSAGNSDPLRTNDTQQLQVEVVDEVVQLDPVAIAATSGVLLNGSASLDSGGVYQVTFEVVNIDGTNAVTVDVGVDIGAGGGLSGAEYYMKDVVIPAGGSSGPKVITMAADDNIRGVAGAASDAAIHFVEVKRVS